MYFDRLLRGEIMKYMDGAQAVIILGSRQVGKTTLMKILMENIKAQQKAFYLDLEESRNLDIVNRGPDNLLDHLSFLGASRGERSYVFLDEIHYMDDPSKFLKLCVDHHSDKIKIIATGSSTLAIKMKFKDSMAGRKFVFNLYPLTFKEFLWFKEKKQLAENLPEQPFDQEQDPTLFFEEEYRRLFNEFLIFGSYPAIALENSFEKKEKLLGDIVSSYIYKDIRSLFTIDDISKFNKLVKLLASQAGQLMNISQIARDIELARATVANYMSILENSFLISTLSPYSKSMRVEVRKASKIYWLDNGLRNYLIGDLSPSSSRADIGALLENIIFTGLMKKKKEIEQLFFWRTKNKTEIDFVYQSGKRIIPIEVKTHARTQRGMMSFLKRHKLQKGYIAHIGNFQKGNISFIPGYWLA